MVSYPGTPGTIELLGLKDAFKICGTEYNTLTQFFQYHLSKSAEKSRYYLSDLLQKKVYYGKFSFLTKRNKKLCKRRKLEVRLKVRKENCKLILKPQLLYSVLLLLPPVSCACFAISFVSRA